MADSFWIDFLRSIFLSLGRLTGIFSLVGYPALSERNGVLKLPSFYYVVWCSSTSQVLYAVFDFVAVLQWQPIVTDCLEFFGGTKGFERHQEEVVVDVGEFAAVVAAVGEDDGLLAGVLVDRGLLSSFVIAAVSLDTICRVLEGVERIMMPCKLRIVFSTNMVPDILASLVSSHLEVPTLPVFLFLLVFINGQNLLVEERPHPREKNNWMVTLLCWIWIQKGAYSFRRKL